MLIVDQVLCDCCGCDMGKLMSQPAPQSDLLPDLRVPPHVVTCPDCIALQSEVGEIEHE